jgi:hypothetical protein
MRKGRNIKTKNKKYERSNYPDAGKNWPLPKPLPRSGRGFKSSSKKSPSLLGFRRRGRNSPEKNQLPDYMGNMTIFPKSGHILALF